MRNNWIRNLKTYNFTYCTSTKVGYNLVSFTFLPLENQTLALPLRHLADIASIFVGIPSIEAVAATHEGASPLVTVRDLRDFRVNERQLGYCLPSSLQREKYETKTGDLLISSRSTALKLAIVPPSLDSSLINATVIAIRSLPRLHPRLLAAYLSHPIGLAELESVAQSGSLQMNLTVRALGRLLVPVPTEAAQDQMVRLLEASDESFQSALDAAQIRRQIAETVVADKLWEKPLR